MKGKGKLDLKLRRRKVMCLFLVLLGEGRDGVFRLGEKSVITADRMEE
jgi:hypothetical protein